MKLVVFTKDLRPLELAQDLKLTLLNLFLLKRGEIKVLKRFQTLVDKKGCQGHVHIRLKTLSLLTKCLWPILNSQGVTWF